MPNENFIVYLFVLKKNNALCHNACVSVCGINETAVKLKLNIFECVCVSNNP